MAAATGDPITLRLSRRQFLGAASGALVVTFATGAAAGARTPNRLLGIPEHLLSGTRVPRRAIAASGANAVTGWVSVLPDETVRISFGGAEMGQGSMTGLAQAVAEELMVDWSVVTTVAAPTDQSYITAGSSAIRNNLHAMRVAGAQAREMLIAAAAQRWGISKSRCEATQGLVVDTQTNASLSYGELAGLAATMAIPSDPPLVSSDSFRVIGKPVHRVDIPSKTNGSAIYGIDVMLPGMVFAAVRHSPVIGGTLRTKPRKPAGTIAVVGLGDAVAVVASNTWKAMQALRELNAGWTDPAGAASMTSSAILSAAKDLMAGDAAVTAEHVGGNVADALAGASQVLTRTYELPYLAHGSMEVLNCTVRIKGGRCEIWAPTQTPGWCQATAAALTGLPASKVTVHVTLLGGGLGRKIEQDYISQAVRVAMAVKKPVKLTWSREEDFGHDQYRPMALSRVRAGLDSDGNVVAWQNRIVSPSILFQRGWIGPNDNDSQSTEGATDLPYAMGARLVEYTRHPAAVPVGFWRSVGHSINGFVVESMIDELADAAGVDPVAFRRSMLQGDARTLKVLNSAADLGNWGGALPAGHARGVALCASFGSITAQVVEISKPSVGTIRVHKVACVVDCGMAVNPNQVEAQVQGGIAHGLSAALWGQVTFDHGRASARNFSNYRVLRMGEMPLVSVKVIQSGEAIGGIGEVAVPPIGPAVANALFALTGQRVRSLPFFPGATMGEGD